MLWQFDLFNFVSVLDKRTTIYLIATVDIMIKMVYYFWKFSFWKYKSGSL
jgi:hypothetical protein